MNNRWVKIFATVMLSATAALAQSNPSALESLFDGKAGAGLTGFTPQSVVPVVGRTKDVTPPAVGNIRASGDIHTADVIPVALEVVVPVSAQETEAVAQGIGKLSAGYRFSEDTSFRPVKLPLFHILPFPEPQIQEVVFLVRGAAPSSRLEAMRAAGLVRNVYKDPVVDSMGLGEVLLKVNNRVLGVPGVRSAYVGFDCGVKGPHEHIMAHHPAIVVELDGTVSRDTVREQVYQAAPSLAVEPVIFVAAK